jgi:VanZ family protein
LGVSPDNRVVIALGVAIALVYSASDEFHQTFVRGRHGTPLDVLVDSIGMTIAAMVASRYARRRSLGPSRPRAA